MHRIILPLAIASFSFGCGASEPSATANPTPPVTASASASAERSPETTATAIASTEAPVPDAALAPFELQPALARLPNDAAVYALLRPAALDKLIDWSERSERIRRQLRKLVDGGTIVDVLRTAGVDPRAPIAVAVVAPDVVQATKLVDALANANPSDQKAAQAVFAKQPADGVFIRFVVPPLVAVDALSGLDKLTTNAGLTLLRCPQSPSCGELGASSPSAIIEEPSWTAAIYQANNQLEVDVLASGVFDKAQRGRALAARRARATGGPQARCSKLDPGSDLSLCVDATRTGELGAATGLTRMASALTGVDPKMRGRIVQVGKKEAGRNVELAKPKKVVVDDGTLSVSVAKTGYRIVSTWQLGKASALAFEAAFAREQCVAAAALKSDLMPVLLKAIGDPGPDFAQLDQRVEHVKEAGAMAFVVAFGRTWPNFLAAFAKRELPGASTLASRVCVKTAEGRLLVQLEGPAFPFFDRL